MRTATRIALLLQATLALIWHFIYLTADSSNWGIFAFFIIIFGAHVPLLLFAAWTCWQHPSLRRQAAWAILIPFISLATSITLRELIGDALSASSLLILGAVLAFALLLFCVARPANAVRFVPQALFASRGFNRCIIALQVVGLALPLGLFLFFLASNAGKTLSAGMGLAYALIAIALYVAALGLFSMFVAVFAWLGLRGNAESSQRRAHVVQLAVGLPGLLLGIVATVLLVTAG